MTRVLSIHEYVLKPDADAGDFERAVRAAEERGLLDLPGLVEHYLLKGIRGDRDGRYAAVWVYESRAAWETLWGPVDDPVSRDDYPEPWKEWEDEVLAPFLDTDPDAIRFTSFAEIS